MKITTRRATMTAIVPLLALLPMSAFCQKPKPKPKPPVKKPPVHETKGTTQMAGAYVKFGEIYSLKNGFNFEILSAKYSMDIFHCYETKSSNAREKLVVLDIAIKDWMKEAKDFGNGDSLVTLIDSGGQKYSGGAQLKSKGISEYFISLKPGEGLGQPGLHDPLRMAFSVPLDAEIVKIMINQPRVGKNEEVLRYCIAGTDKEADPSNIIAPLPAEVRDPANKAGAVAMPMGNAKMNVPMAMGTFTYEVQKIDTVTEPLSKHFTPDDGTKYVIATIKITNLNLKPGSFYDAVAHDSYAKDADGDKFPAVGVAKLSNGEEPTIESIDPGGSVTVRFVFQVSASATPTGIVFAGIFYPWKLDLTP